jgi:hypothetical protein
MKKKHASPPAKAVVVRNSMARHPLLGKGAVHEKTGKARRRAARVALRKTEFERDAVTAASGQSPVCRRSARPGMEPYCGKAGFGLYSRTAPTGKLRSLPPLLDENHL